MTSPVSLPQIIDDVKTLGAPYVRGVGAAMAEVVAAFKGAAEQLIAEPEASAPPEEETTDGL